MLIQTTEEIAQHEDINRLHQQEWTNQNQQINVNINTMTQNTTENLENYQDMEENSFDREYEQYW